MEGFIKLNRKLLDWEWITEPNTVTLWIHILLRANWQESKWKGMTIPKGSFVTSLSHLAEESGLTLQQTRTSLNRLISTHSITKTSTNKFTLITIVKWADYQCSDDDANTQINTQVNNRITNEQQQIKNIKNIKNKKRNAFVNFSQRKYDFDALEREVLNGIDIDHTNQANHEEEFKPNRD